MKLHLPKLLRNAVLACIAAVAGITTTVGTAAFTGGVVAFALVAPQAMADAHWIGTSDTYEASAWHTQANWDTPFAVENKGPGVPNSNLWQPIFLDGVTIGSVSDRVAMEGWNIRLNLDNGAALYATTKKFQSGDGGKCHIQVNGGSTLDINILDGNFYAATFDVGANSSITFGLTQAEKGTSGLTVNLNGAGAQMNFVSAVGGGSVLTGTVNVNAELGMIASGTKVTQETGLSVENVTLQNLSFDFGRYYTLSDSEITDENAQSKKGQYWYYLDTDGQYKVTYVQHDYINIKGGTLTWDANTLFDGIACTGNEPVMFTTADSTVTMAADVTVDIVDVKDNIHASIGGDETLTVDQVILGEGAQLSILKASALAMTSVSMDAEARLNIATGGETTVQEALGSATWTGGSIGVTNGTTLNLSDSILNSSNIVVDGVGSKIVLSNCGNEAGEVFLGGNIKLQNGAIMELSGDDIVDGTNYNKANKYEILSNSELRMGNGRFSINSSDQIILNNGKITGAGEGSNGAIDFIENIAATVVSDGTSSIDSIRMRNGSTVTYKVQTGTLTIASISDGAYSDGNLVKTGTGKLILTGGIGYGGTTTVSTGELVLQGTNTADQLITVGENGTLTIDAGANCTLVKGIQGNGILNLQGTLTMAASACQELPGSSELSDGENGFAAASMLVVGECGTINVGDAASLIIDGTSYSGDDIYVSDGKLGVLLGAEVNPYYVNTEVTYDAETMASATEFLIRSTGVLTTGDAGVLSKVRATESGATVRLDGSGEAMTIAAQSTYTGEVVIASGTTVELTNATGLGVNYINNKNRSIIVEDGATLKYTADMYYKLVLQEGATLSNESVSSGTNMMQNPYIELQGDATVNSNNLFGMRFGGADATKSETLALNGHTLTKTGSGTFFLHKTTLTAGTIDVQEGTLAFEAEGTGCSGTQNVDIKLQSGAKFLVKQNGKGVRSLTLYGTGNSAQVEITGSNEFTINGMTTAEVLLEKSGSGTLKLNAATLAAGAKVTDGTLTLQGATSLGSVLTIENGKSLTVNDGVVVTLSGLSGFKETNSNGTIPTTNGLVEGSTYKIVDNKNANNANNGLTKVTYQGKEYTLDNQGCIAAGAKIFYVVEAGADKVVTVGGNSATAQTAEATEFYVGENGTLKMVGQANDTMTVDKMLTSTAGSGTIIYAAGTNTLTNGSRTVFAGDLEIAAGSTMALGSSATGGPTSAADVNISSLNSIILNGGTLFTRGVTGNLGNVISKAGSTGSVLTIFDQTGENSVASGSIEIEKLELNADLKLACNWKSNINISKLTGAGKMTVERGSGDIVNIRIDSFGGFTGSMEIGAAGKTTNVNATLRYGENLEASKITLHNTSMTLAGSGTFKLGSATALQQGMSLGTNWAGTVEITNATISDTKDLTSLNSSAGSQLSIKGLTVADGAALSLDGAVTLGGTVTAAESIANAGALTFASDIQLDLTGMNVTSGANNKKVITLLAGGGSSNLSSLTIDALTSSTKEMGTDWQFNADGTISYTAYIPKFYWEGENDADWGSKGWSTVDDNAESLTSFVSGADVYFTNTDSSVTVGADVTVGSMTVSGADYTFSGNGIITASELEIGTDAAATFTYGKLNLGALSELTVDGTMVLGTTEISTADLTALVKLATGAGRLEVKGHGGDPNACLISMGDTALTQGIGTLYVDGYYGISGGNVADTTTSYTIGAGKTMEVAAGKCVRIQQGAKLVLDGGSLTGKSADSYIQMGGDSNTTDNAYGHIEIKNGGTLSIGKIEVKGGDLQNTISMSGGTLEITGTNASITGMTTKITGGTLKAGANSWSIAGGSVGGVTVDTGEGTITLSGVTLTSTIDNSAGKLALSGSINIQSENYVTTQTPTVFSSTIAGNGYAKTNTEFVIATDAATLVTTGVTGWTVDNVASNVSYANGVVTLTGTDWTTEYYITSQGVTYSSIAKQNGEGEALTAIVLNGAKLTLDADLGSVALKAAAAASQVEITGTGILSATSLSGVDATHQVTLSGAGTYALAAGENTKSADVILDSTYWTGTVKLSGFTESKEINLNGLGNEHSSVKLVGVKGSIQDDNAETGTHLILSKDGEANGFEVTSSSGVTYTFNKGVSGEGDFYVTSTNSGDTYKFAGDLSGWTGSFKVGDGAGSQNVVINSTEETVAVNLNRNGNTLNATLEGTTGISMTGTLDVSKLTVNVNTSFTGTVTTAELVNTSTTSVVNDLSLTSLSNSGALTATGKSITVTGGLSGIAPSEGATPVCGSITAKSLTLQGASNTVGDLTLTGALTLGTAEAVSRLDADKLKVGAVTLLNVDSAVKDQPYTSIIAATSLSQSMVITMSDALLKSKLGEAAEKTITLLTLKTAVDGINVTLAGLTEDAAAATTQISVDGTTSYTLLWDTDKKVLTLKAELLGSGWKGLDGVDAADNVDLALWSEATSWSDAAVPTKETIVKLDGSAGGQQTIWMEGTGNAAKTLTVDHLSGYTLRGVDSTAENKLTIEEKLTVNRGTLNLRGVDVEVKGNLELNCDAASVQNWQGNQLSIGGNLANNGTIYNADSATLKVTGDVTNIGNITNDGSIEVTGGVTNTGTIALQKGTTTITGAVDNDDRIEVTGGTLSTGAVDNDGTITISGGLADDGKTPLASVTVNGGLKNTNSISIGTKAVEDDPATTDKDESAAATYGTLTVNGNLTNSGTLSVNGNGSSLAMTGKLTNTNGTITIDEDGSLKVNGDLDNTNGTITIGTASVKDNPDTPENEAVAATTGSLTVTGSLTHSGSKDKLVVNEESSLSVGGNLNASDMELAFGGDVTVGGTATVDKLTIADTATFTAKNATIGTLTNDGALTVETTLVVDSEGNAILDAEGNKQYDDGNLSITTLSGHGNVTVAEGGSLSIVNSTNFTGELDNKGSIVVSNADGVTLSTQTDNGGIIDAPKLTISSIWVKDGEIVAPGTEGATLQETANGSKLTSLKTDTLVFENLETTATTPVLSTEELAVKTTDGKITIVLSEVENSSVNSTGITHLLSIENAMPGTVADNFDLSRYGYDETGAYDAESDAVQSEYMQNLLAKGLIVRFGETDPTSGIALLAAGGVTDLYGAVDNQTLPESTWTIGKDAGTGNLMNATGSGLVVTDSSTADGIVLKNASILDNVRQVVVNTDATIDLTSLDTTEEKSVQINGLSGSANLTVKNTDQNTIDYVKISDVYTRDGSTSKQNGAYTGTLSLSGKLDATLDLKGDKVAATSDVVLDGKMTNGSLSVAINKLGDDAVADASNLSISNTKLNIAYNDGGATAMDTTNVADKGHVLVDLGAMKGTANGIFIGQNNTSSVLVDKYFTNFRFDKTEGAVVADRNTTYYSDSAGKGELSENGSAGLELASAALAELNPQSSNPDGGLSKMLTALDAAIAAGNTSSMDELGAALAGASNAVLGMAAHGDLDRQVQAIRNRTTTMGVDQSVVHDDMPYFNAWINAEGNFSEMSDSETAGGYKLNSWGGTVGFDVDFTPTFTAGMALTAMYGDLSVTGVDQASGDLNSYYVSAFARYCASAWTHTFVATVGLTDISMNRTVMGEDIDSTTDGMGFALMYEVGHVFALDEDATACLQPIFNITWRHTSVNGYDEKGSDLALKVGSQTLDTVTLGLGARMQAVVGESMYNRTSIFEARVLAKFDIGDRRSTTDVQLAGAKVDIESAERGAIGLEAGAGLTIPLGDDGGNLFMDAAVELRADYMNVNGTVGYRINF